MRCHVTREQGSFGHYHRTIPGREINAHIQLVCFSHFFSLRLFAAVPIAPVPNLTWMRAYCAGVPASPSYAFSLERDAKICRAAIALDSHNGLCRRCATKGICETEQTKVDQFSPYQCICSIGDPCRGFGSIGLWSR
jgi:hypothetical protein